MKFACVKGGTRARSISLDSISQAAFDLAQANTPADRACILLTLHMPAANNRPGAILPLDEAERLGLSVLEAVKAIREEDRRLASGGLPCVS